MKRIGTFFTLSILFLLMSSPVWAGSDEVLSDADKDGGYDTDLKIVAPRAKPERRPWKLSISAGGGYDSNVLLMGDGFPLPVSITNKGAGYGRFTLDGSYRWEITPDDYLTAGYSFLAKIYDNIAPADLVDHYWFAEHKHFFAEDWAGLLRISDEYQTVGGLDFSNQFVVRPAIVHKWVDWTNTELYYQFAATEFYLPVVANVFDRDSDAHTVGFLQRFYVPDTQIFVYGGYGYTWNDADGLDFDYERHALEFGVSSPIIWDVTGSLAYTHTWDSYNNLNSFSPAGRFTKRRDDGDFISVRLTRPINDMLSVYVRYDYNQNEGNIMFYQYDQHIWTAGIIADF